MNKEVVIYTHHRHTNTHTHTHNGILLSHKKEGNLAICNYIDGLRGYYPKEKDKYCMISLICGI